MNLTVAIWDGCSLVGRGLQGGVRRLERGFTTGHRSGVPVLVHGQYLAGCSGVEFWFSRTVGEPGRVVRWCFFDVKARPGGSATKEKFRSEPGGLNQLMGGTTLVAFRGGFGVGEEGLGAFAGAVHDLLILGNGLELGGDVGEVQGAVVFDGVLERFEFGVEAKAVVLHLKGEAAALLDGESDGAELIGNALERRVAGPDEGAGAAAVGSGVGKGFVSGEGEGGLGGGAASREEVVAAGVAEEVSAEGVVEDDGAIERCGKDAVGGVGGSGAGLRGEASCAGFVNGDGEARGLELGVLEGVGNVRGGERSLGRERRGGVERATASMGPGRYA